jgi:hypothetical protein
LAGPERELEACRSGGRKGEGGRRGKGEGGRGKKGEGGRGKKREGERGSEGRRDDKETKIRRKRWRREEQIPWYIDSPCANNNK